MSLDRFVGVDGDMPLRGCLHHFQVVACHEPPIVPLAPQRPARGIYSPIQMAAELPEHYLQHREAFRFIEDVPVDWEDSRTLDGEVGDYVTIARKDRHSQNWYPGSITDEHGRALSVPLSFLDPKRRYRAEIYRDGDGADYRSNPFAFTRETREVSSVDSLTLKLAPGGGQAIRFVAL